jgi:hypothetical protein
MSRPTLEVADIIRASGNRFIERNREHLAWPQLKVLRAIRDCRTAALGGHVDRCAQCGHQAISYNSCRNRNCPKCQASAREEWLKKQSADLLPVPYFHVVFTLPHELSAVALQNKRVVYNLLLNASAQTLLEIAADPKHLGAVVGFLSVFAYVGPESAASSPRSLRHSGRRTCSGSFKLDPVATWILPARPRIEYLPLAG